MSAYTNYSLDDIEYIGGIRYRLKKPLIWRIGNQFGPAYVVPAGFEFDVSIPVYLRWLFNPHDLRYLKAAALHDHMLYVGKSADIIRLQKIVISFCPEDNRPELPPEDVKWSRAQAASTFYDALKADGVGRVERLAMFQGVFFKTVE